MSDERIDLRPYPVWERSPVIYAAFDTLAEGETMTFVTNNAPRALMTRIELMRPKQAVWCYRRVGEKEWTFTLTRLEAEFTETSAQGLLRRSFVFSVLAERDRAACAVAELEARKALPRERGHIRYLDRAMLLEIIEGS